MVGTEAGETGEAGEAGEAPMEAKAGEEMEVGDNEVA